MIDQLIVAAYLVLTLLIGLYVGRNTKTVEEFAIGKRNFSSVVLLSTIFATVIDGGGTIGLAETVYSLGPIYCASFLGIAISYLGLALIVAPRFGNFLGLISSGDILGKLYGDRAKIFMGFATIFESTMLIGMQILAITHVMQYFFAIKPGVAAIIVSLIILLYSFKGGIKSVTATDVFQFGILIVAIPLLCGIVIFKIGGIDGFVTAFNSPPASLEKVDYFKQIAMLVSFSLPALFPRTIQRMLMAKSESQIKTTFLYTGLLCVPFYLIVGSLGIAAWVMSPGIETSLVFPNLINEAIPIGLKGFIVAGLLAVFMSSIDSDLNLSSIAVTHDIFSMLYKKPVSEKIKLRIARWSSLFVAAIAVGLALYFDNIMAMIYFLLCISNSAFFPGYLLGFLGLKPGTRGFWWGVAAACLSVLFCTFVLDLFLLYAGLVSIALNVIVLMGFHLFETYGKEPRRMRSPFIEPPKIASSFQHGSVVCRPDYCLVFAIFALIGNMVPFFLLPPHSSLEDHPHLFLCIVSTVLSFTLIFREVWWDEGHKFFKPILYVTLTTSLTGLSFVMYLKSGFGFVWGLDLVLCFGVLLLLTNKRHAWMIGCAGLFLGFSLNFLSGSQTSYQSITPALWSLALHIAMLIGYLQLFRNQDAQRYRILGGKLAHEASRSMSSLTMSAEFLELTLPNLVGGYEWAHKNGFSKQNINSEMIDELKSLPGRLQSMGQRTAKTVDVLLGKICFTGDTSAAHIETDILTCIENAVADPSISREQRDKIRVIKTHNFSIFGEPTQLSQAILNIIENALYSIARTEGGNIKIWVDGYSVFILDNGPGISRKDMPNIFDEFFSTKKTLGQGLAFCKQVMLEHGGGIHCHSDEGHFAQFELSFPRR